MAKRKLTEMQQELVDAARNGEVTWLRYLPYAEGADWRISYLWTTRRTTRGVTTRVRRLIANGTLKECRVLTMGENRGMVRPNDGTFITNYWDSPHVPD